MSAVDNISQYYNLYDSTKGYTELLFRAGKVLQSKEVNELQSMLKNQIKNVGDTILTNGDIIEGCQLIVADDMRSATVTKGKVYLNGDVRTVDTTTVTIKGTGTEIIGVLLQESVITPDDDSSLLDVSTGYDNYNQDGAYRLKEYVEITVDNSDASVLYTLIDGSMQTTNTAEDLTQLDKINATLARRTFDESGNYKVEGLKLLTRNYTDDDHLYVSLEAGRAYVKGYEVNKTTASMVALDRAKSTRDVSSEPKVYRNGTLKYALNNAYPNAITRVVATVEVTDSTVTRSSIKGGVDYLNTVYTPVVSIVSVSQGDTTYVEGTDFQLTNNGIDWSLSGAEPNTGTSYTVVWRYNKTMAGPDAEKPDYDLYYDSDTDIGYLEFTETGDKPVNGTSVLVTYNYLLCRRDVISLDKDGNIIVTKGQPDVLRTVESPAVSTSDALVIGSVLIKPNSDELAIINNATQAVSMLSLYNMLDRISTIELNQAVSDLDNEAADGEDATELAGILTDGFLGISKCDTYHTDFSATIDMDEQCLVLPFDTSLSTLVPDTTNNYNVTAWNRLITAPASEITLVSQSLATGYMQVNSYNAFPDSPSVKISPEVDNWIDNSTITLNGGTRTATVTLRRWWYHRGESWAASEKAVWQSYGYTDGGASLGWSNGSATTTTEIINSVLNEAILYMRQTSVTVSGYKLGANTDNVIVTFDGIPVTMAPAKPAYKGTTAGTLKADSDGFTQGYFTIPANTVCGTKEVTIYATNTPTLAGTTQYTANGRKITTTKTVYTTYVTLRTSDPVAQSFQFDTDQHITAVGVYFRDKDLTEAITVQVRNMVNGYPGTTVYAEKVVQPADIKYSTNGTAETKITFDDPIYCDANTQYCFTILSNSDVDTLYIAETSNNDLTTGNKITKNPYINGVLFSSSNALTWTAHNNSDLKFNIYGAQFETTGSVVFKQISNVSLDRLMVASEEEIPSGCSVTWQYRINEGDWNPIEVYDDRELSEFATKVDVKCSITANTHSSPAIAIDCLQLAGFKNKSTGTYVSRNVSVEEGFNHVKIVADICIPSGCNVTFYYATDSSGTDWKAISTSITPTQKSTTYSTYTYEDDLSETAKNYRVKIVMTNNGSINRPSVMNLKNIMKTV